MTKNSIYSRCIQCETEWPKTNPDCLLCCGKTTNDPPAQDATHDQQPAEPLWNDPPDIPVGPGGINITDGEDSGEYLQRMSDGTARNFWRHLDAFLAGVVGYLEDHEQANKAHRSEGARHVGDRTRNLLAQARALQRERQPQPADGPASCPECEGSET